LIATARGTVGMEMSLFGIPTIALFDNLYVNFSFVDSCATKERYYNILKGLQSPEIHFDNEKIFSFYYQAFMEKTADSETNVFNLLRSFNGESYSDRYLEFILSHADEIFNNQVVKYYQDQLE
jgi:hypothetical protein